MKQVYKFMKDASLLMKFIHSLDKMLLPITILHALLAAILPYILIVGGAMILDSLIVSNWELAITQAGIMIITSFIVSAIMSILMETREAKGMTINRLCNAEVCMKSISLDYQTFEDKKNLEDFRAADYNSGTRGGFGSYIIDIRNFFEGIISFGISMIFIIQLCFMTVDNPAYFAFFISKTGSIICISIVIIVLGLIYSRLAKYMNENNLKLYQKSITYDQRYQYFSEQLFMDDQIAKDMRMYHMKDMIYEKWKALSIEVNSFDMKRWHFDMNTLLSSSVLNDIVIFLAYLLVIMKTIVHAVSIGEFTKYVGTIRQLNASLKQSIDAICNMEIKHSYLSFYTAYMKKENMLNTGNRDVERNEDQAYEIAFHNVSFCYPGSDEYSLKNVSCKLNLKNKLAVVGRNGAGKTTFIKLLCRLYEVSEGSITLNGVDIREYDYDQYLNLFAVVFQDFALFSIPLKENIAGVNIHDQKVWDVLKSAGIHEIVEKFPDELDTLLYHDMGEGIDVSGGQAQKFAIARALYKDAPFVVLDEPTAALDPISEYEIYEKFNTMVKDKTSVYISHRMSSCKFCDDVYVFDKGQLIQKGNHDSLLNEDDGVYAKLWNAQAKYYSE